MNLIRLEPRHEHPRRPYPISCILLHSTGSLDEDAISHYYQTSSSGVCPHYLILRRGDVRQFVDLDRVAYHTAMSDDQEQLYRGGRDVWTRRLKDGRELDAPFSGYAEWLARWPDKASPLELPSGAEPNGRSVGIELVAERGACTDEQYATLVELLRMVGKEVGVQLGPETVYGHGDANPVARADRHGLTDPGPLFDWERLYAAIG